MSAAPKAPDFANGVYLSSVNLGTTIGTAVAGMIIAQIGTREIVFVGVATIVFSFILIVLRNSLYETME